MARIPEETINRIRDTADILDVVSSYVQLKRRGHNWFGLCPFHQEKTPSFSVNQQKQIFHCFGCGRGGNAISFLMEVEKLDFVDAVKRLGEQVGIEVELSGPSDPRRKATVQQIMDLYELATALYQKNLQGSAGAKVRDYLVQRGILPPTQALFKLGYALPQWDQLLKAVADKKFSQEALNKSGLFIAGERGPYDRFRSRIMFPISSVVGRALALAGRVYDTDDPAKYVNSPETPVYHKSAVLYGLHLSRNFIRERDTAIIVEGYLDLIQLYQAGIKHVVAVSGTALTNQHARELKKLTPHIVLAYDGDAAGIQAAIRGGYTLLRGGLSPKITQLPEGMDPDDWVKEAGPEPFLQATQEALPLVEFHVRHFQGNLRETADLRRFLEEGLQELAQVPDPLVRELHLKELAELTGIDERRLHEALRAIPKRRYGALQRAEEAPQQAPIVEPTRSHKAQMALIQLAFQENETALNLLADMTKPDLFTHPVLQRIWAAVSPQLHSGNIPEPRHVMDQLPEESDRQILSHLLMRAEETSDPMILAIDCLTTLRRDDLKREIELKRQGLREAEQAGEATTELIAEIAALQRHLGNIGEQFESYRQP
ncbi:DNA primase [subsurface metagenome]